MWVLQSWSQLSCIAFLAHGKPKKGLSHITGISTIALLRASLPRSGWWLVSRPRERNEYPFFEYFAPEYRSSRKKTSSRSKVDCYMVYSLLRGAKSVRAVRVASKSKAIVVIILASFLHIVWGGCRVQLKWFGMHVLHVYRCVCFGRVAEKTGGTVLHFRTYNLALSLLVS